MNSAHPQAQMEQTATTSRTSADVAAELEPLQAELDALPEKLGTMKRAAISSIAIKDLGDCFAIIEQLKVRERILHIHVWRLRKEKLRLEISEAEALPRRDAIRIASEKGAELLRLQREKPAV